MGHEVPGMNESEYVEEMPMLPVMASFRFQRWCQLMFQDGLCMFTYVYVYLDILPHFFFDKGMARKSPSISFLGHRASQNHVVATSTMQDFADQGSVLLLGRDEKNVFFRGGRNPR